MLFFLFFCSQQLNATIYYSRNATGGAWSSTASWTLSSTGIGASAPAIPQRTDSVVILNGHTIEITAINDNGSAGVSPDDLNRTNIGGFSGDGTDAFYHTGYIWIQSRGTLTSTVRLMFEGKVVVANNGTLETTSNDDLVLLGNTQFEAGCSVSIDDDIICTGNSTTYIGSNGSFSADDLYLDHTDALLCGDTLTIDDAIQEFNGADAEDQLCSNFIVVCTDGNCCNSRPPNPCTSPYGGTGNFTLPVDLTSFLTRTFEDRIDIEWETQSEINNDYFLVERLQNSSWEAIGQVTGNGTTNEFHFYQYSDYEVNVTGAAYYRLRQFDFNSQENLSQIIQSEVLVNQGHKYKFVQNGSRIALNFLDRHDESATIQVVTAEGRIVFDKTFDIVHKEQSVEIDLSEYSSGWYVLGIIGADNAHFEKMILLNAAK